MSDPKRKLWGKPGWEVWPDKLPTPETHKGKLIIHNNCSNRHIQLGTDLKVKIVYVRNNGQFFDENMTIPYKQSKPFHPPNYHPIRIIVKSHVRAVEAGNNKIYDPLSRQDRHVYITDSNTGKIDFTVTF